MILRAAAKMAICAFCGVLWIFVAAWLNSFGPDVPGLRPIRAIGVLAVVVFGTARMYTVLEHIFFRKQVEKAPPDQSNFYK